MGFFLEGANLSLIKYRFQLFDVLLMMLNGFEYEIYFILIWCLTRQLSRETIISINFSSKIQNFSNLIKIQNQNSLIYCENFSRNMCVYFFDKIKSIFQT